MLRTKTETWDRPFISKVKKQIKTTQLNIKLKVPYLDDLLYSLKGKNMLMVTDMIFVYLTTTRKSSCVNARGILTAAYQVLHLLSCRGGTPAGGYPIPAGGLPHLGYPRLTWPGGTPSLLGIPHLGYPIPHQTWPGGTLTRSSWGGTWGGVPPVGPDQGGTPSMPGYPTLGIPRLDLARVPTRRCGQTENITFPHPSDAVGNNGVFSSSVISMQCTSLPVSPFMKIHLAFPIFLLILSIFYLCLVALAADTLPCENKVHKIIIS